MRFYGLKASGSRIVFLEGGNAGRCSAWVLGCGSATAEVLRKGTFSTPGRSYVQGANGVGDLG